MHERASQPWSAAEKKELLTLVKEGATTEDLSHRLGRSKHAIARQVRIIAGLTPQGRKPAVRRRRATEYLS